MTFPIAFHNQSQTLFNRSLTTAWRNKTQLFEPSVWQQRNPHVEEDMLRDADIAHAVQYRRHLIAGRDWNLTPRVESSPRGDLAVAIGTELVGGIKHFTEGRMGLARAFFSGSRFAKIHGEHQELNIGDGVTRVWWVPVALEDIDKRQFRIVPENDGKKIDAHWERWDLATGTWLPESVRDAIDTVRHVYDDDQLSQGHGRALREALGWWHYAKTNVFQESLQAVERFAQGIITARVAGARDADTGKPNQAVIDEWADVLEDMRSRHILVLDAEDQVEMVKMDGQGWQMLAEIRQELRSTIFTLVLGANLTTAADSGGSYALAEIQENSTEALIQYDRETLEETLSDDLMSAIWFHNHANLIDLGVQDQMPRFAITQEKKQDPKERAEVFGAVNSMGVRIPLDDVYEQTGIRKPEEGEDILEGAMPLGAPLGFDAPPAPEIDAAPEAEAIQETAMNGAQVTAAAELIIQVVQGQMPPGVAARMLVSMFNIDPAEAKAMVDESVAFTPMAPPPEAPEMSGGDAPPPPMGGTLA